MAKWLEKLVQSELEPGWLEERLVKPTQTNSAMAGVTAEGEQPLRRPTINE